MSDHREKIFSAMTGAPAITALVGNEIYPEAAPDNGKLPAIVFAEITRIPQVTHSGDTGFDSVTMQVTAWAKTRDAATAIRDTVRATLSNLSPGLPIDGPLIPESLDAITDNQARAFGCSVTFRYFTR